MELTQTTAAKVLRGLGIALLVPTALPMLFVTIGFVNGIGHECIPGNAKHTAAAELAALAIAWLVFLLPAAPAIWIVRSAPRRPGIYALALGLALVADVASVFMLLFAAFAHMC